MPIPGPSEAGVWPKPHSCRVPGKVWGPGAVQPRTCRCTLPSVLVVKLSLVPPPPPCPGLEGLGFRQGHSHPFSGSEGRRPAGSRGPVTPGLAQSAGVAASRRAGSASLRPRLLWQWVPPRGAGGRPGREGLEPGRPPQPRRLPAACRPACARQAAPARCRCPEEPDLRARAPGPPSPAGEPQRCRPAWSLATWTESPWLVSVLRVSESTAHGLGRL